MIHTFQSQRWWFSIKSSDFSKKSKFSMISLKNNKKDDNNLCGNLWSPYFQVFHFFLEPPTRDFCILFFPLYILIFYLFFVNWVQGIDSNPLYQFSSNTSLLLYINRNFKIFLPEKADYLEEDLREREKKLTEVVYWSILRKVL